MDVSGSRYEYNRINRYNFKFPGVLSWWFQMAHTVDGKSPANQLIGSLSHYLQGFIHSRWCRISSINCLGSTTKTFSIRGVHFLGLNLANLWYSSPLYPNLAPLDFSFVFKHGTHLKVRFLPPGNSAIVTFLGWWKRDPLQRLPLAKKWPVLPFMQTI